MGAYAMICADKLNYSSFTLQNCIKGMQVENIVMPFFVKIRDFAILIGTALQVKLRRR